jgi:predicted nuclease with RNAse H fold
MADNQILGIDYGSNLAGTTAVCHLQGSALKFQISRKGSSADEFLLKTIKELKPALIFIDAPLSLPLVYKSSDKADDFFYRTCDRALGAMSPMFLGGLTARAMRLVQPLVSTGIEVYETYPAHTAKVLQLAGYKKHMEPVQHELSELSQAIGLKTQWPDPITLHHIDAFLAWYSGMRFLRGEHITTGKIEEGIIIN